VATISVNQSHITQGTTKMNDTYYSPGSKYDTPIWRAAVVCQEVGHTFGLDHQDTNQDNANLGSCMDYTHDPDGTAKSELNNEHPNLHDFEELAIIYTHDDGSKKPGPPSGNAANSSRSVQVRQQGQYTVVTFILWA
jgi:hypothetical protein